MDGGLPILRNLLSGQVQPAQSVLGILVPLGRRGCEKPDRLGALIQAFGVGKQLPAQQVLSLGISAFRFLPEGFHRFFRLWPLGVEVLQEISQIRRLLDHQVFDLPELLLP